VPIPEAIITLDAWDESINMMIVADSGWGKTVLAGTADQRTQDGPKALFLATENGTISAKRQGSTADVWPIRRWRDLQQSYQYFNAGTGCDDYDWILLDSITEMQALSMSNALYTSVAEHRKNADPDVPQIQDHLKVQQQTLNMLKRFNALPVNCLYTALPLRLEDANGNPYYLPALDGKQGGIAQQAMGYMHVVGQGIKRTVKDKDDKPHVVRRVYFQTIGPYRAKDRYGVLGNFIDNPNMTQIEELINKGRAQSRKDIVALHRKHEQQSITASADENGVVDAEIVEDTAETDQPATAEGSTEEF
jgi:hypothetical protein